MKTHMSLTDLARGELQARGFSVLRSTLLDEVETMAHALGDVLRVSEVRLMTGVGTHLASPERIPPHTDHPAVRYIAWFCRENQAFGGESVLLDGHKAIDQLSARQRLTLSKAYLRCPTLEGRVPIGQRTVWHERTRSLFFAPWLPRSQEHEQSLRDFERCLDAPPTPRYSVRLEPGDALILDNHRMLHSRDALDRDSPRWLTRYWIGESECSIAASS